MAATNFTPISLYYSTTATTAPSAGNLVAGELAINTTDEKLYFKNTAGTVKLLASSDGATGTVSSVAQSFTGGLISVAGSPITTSGTLALTVAGTSGGVPYFSSGTTWASSAALAANALVVGGGAGAAPSTVTTGSGVLTALGIGTGGAGGFVVNGGALGTPSSGTATNLTGLPLSTGVTGTLPVANGGTGATSLTANNVILGNGTSAVQVVAPGTAGNVLTSDGTTWQSTTPAAGVSLSADNTWTGTQTFNGTTSKLATVLTNAAEVATISGASVTGSLTVDVTTSSVVYYNGNATGNWSINIRGSSGTALNSMLSTGQSITIAAMITQGGTAYYNTSVQVDGTTSGVTTKWQGGTAPSSGNANSIDVYTYTVIKTASATFTVLASQTKFA